MQEFIKQNKFSFMAIIFGLLSILFAIAYFEFIPESESFDFAKFIALLFSYNQFTGNDIGLKISFLLLSFVGFILGIVAFIRKEHKRTVLAAILICGMGFAWKYAGIAILIIIGLNLIG